MVIEIENLMKVFYFTAFTFALTIALTPFLTHFLYKFKLWKIPRSQAISGEAATVYNSLHQHKHHSQIPTMAGVLIWGVVAVLTLLFNLSRSGTYLPLFTLVSFGILGLVDDFINIRGKTKVAGLKFIWKIIWILVLAGIGAWWFYSKLGWSVVQFPGADLVGFSHSVDIGIWYVPLFMLVIVSSANAVNITDGLDGLAGGLLSIAFSAYTIIALSQGKIDLAIFTATIVGAVLAYTWFNIFPARFFMGDTGSLALGATLGVVAMLTNTALVLPIIGLVFVIDTLSVILQLFWKKVFKHKLLPVSPLHHTFEVMGWHESKVTMRLWVIGAIMGVIGLGLALINIKLSLF